jgi:hypothetical protein
VIGIIALVLLVALIVAHPEWLAVYASWIVACVVMGVIVGLYRAVRDTRW